MNPDDFQDTTVDPGDRFYMMTPSGELEWTVAAYYSFGSHATEKIWNGYSADVAIIRLNEPASGQGTPVKIADHRVKSSSAWSTRFGYGCTNRDTQAGAGTKRFRAFQGTNSNFLCSGDSGGPTLWGNGVNANPIWAIHSAYSWNLELGGYHDVVADAAYHKKQIKGVMRSWDGEYESGMDRQGADYDSFASASQAQCRNECAGDNQCRAWTHYAGTCYLKDAIPNWSPLAGAFSGLSPNRPSTPELGFDRPGSDYHNFLFSGNDTTCINACSMDHRCQAYTIAPAGTQKRCWMKDETPHPIYTGNPGIKSAPKRGLAFNRDRLGTVFHEFGYSTPSPETCQSECAKRTQCQSWAYKGPTKTTIPYCWLQSDEGTVVSSAKFVSGLKSEMYR